jgi:HNH endonuclease
MRAIRPMKKKLRKLHLQILEILQSNLGGLSIHDIRAKLPADIGPQEELNKRVRELRYQYNIREEGKKYYYEGVRETPLDNQGVGSKLRAAVLNQAHGRCQMCGRTVAVDGIRLEVDHKIPHNWGGPTTLENLWAICGLCNSGKRDFFKSFNADEMTALVAIESVHVRLAEALRMSKGKPVPSWHLEFVANVNDFQDDWQRRLRELRLLGIEYSFSKSTNSSGKVETTYTLKKWKQLPADPRAAIRKIEREKG